MQPSVILLLLPGSPPPANLSPYWGRMVRLERSTRRSVPIVSEFQSIRWTSKVLKQPVWEINKYTRFKGNEITFYKKKNGGNFLKTLKNLITDKHQHMHFFTPSLLCNGYRVFLFWRRGCEWVELHLYLPSAPTQACGLFFFMSVYFKSKFSC